MAWRIEFARAAERELARLDKGAAQRILRYLRDRLLVADDPRDLGVPMVGSAFEGLWRYRVGDYRLIARLDGEVLTIVVLRVAHRREVYRQGIN